jgi:hypothetical protein
VLSGVSYGNLKTMIPSSLLAIPAATIALSSAFGILLSPCATAADVQTDQKTLMTERGKLLLSDDLKEVPGKGWRMAKGKWEAADGATRGSEIAEEKHGAVMRYALPFHDAVIEYSFKLDGAKMTTLSINDAKEHLCRVLIRPNGFTVQKDDHDHDGPDKAVVFQTIQTPIKPGEWHTVVVEILGKEMLASLDGQKVGFGAHDMIAGAKANLGFTVAGQSASFKNLRVWEALPNKDWPATKAKLAAAK